MFVILVYDVNAKRVSKVKKICERFLIRKQNSVFEGNITGAKLNKLKDQLQKVMDTDCDECIIYKLESIRFASKEEIGMTNHSSNIL